MFFVRTEVGVRGALRCNRGLLVLRHARQEAASRGRICFDANWLFFLQTRLFFAKTFYPYFSVVAFVDLFFLSVEQVGALYLDFESTVIAVSLLPDDSNCVRTVIVSTFQRV